MEPAPGKKAEPGSARTFLFAAGRLVGFLLAAGPAVMILAAVVLLPAYADLLEARYEHATARVETQRLEAMVVGQDRQLAALEAGDPVLVERYAALQLGLQGDEDVVLAGDAPPPGFLQIPTFPDPVRPDNTALRWAGKLRDLNFRRGLLVIVAMLLLGGVLLFAPPHVYRSRT